MSLLKINDIVRDQSTKEMTQTLCRLVNLQYNRHTHSEIINMLRYARRSADKYKLEEKAKIISGIQNLIINKVNN